MKRIASLSVLAFGLVFATGCGSSIKDSCENINSLCRDTQGYVPSDCNAAQTEYDNSTDAQKAASDVIRSCTDNASNCAGVFACALGS